MVLVLAWNCIIHRDLLFYSLAALNKERREKSASNGIFIVSTSTERKLSVVDDQSMLEIQRAQSDQICFTTKKKITFKFMLFMAECTRFLQNSLDSKSTSTHWLSAPRSFVWFTSDSILCQSLTWNWSKTVCIMWINSTCTRKCWNFPICRGMWHHIYGEIRKPYSSYLNTCNCHNLCMFDWYIKHEKYTHKTVLSTSIENTDLTPDLLYKITVYKKWDSLRCQIINFRCTFY